MLTFLQKLKGDGAALPPRAANQQIALAWLGGCLAIASVEFRMQKAQDLVGVPDPDGFRPAR